MIDPAVLIPITLNRSQALLVLVVGGGLLLALGAWMLLEATLTGVASLFLRLTGRTPPTKSLFSTALEELEARVNEKEGNKPPPADLS
jgi:hypothetical protein